MKSTASQQAEKAPSTLGHKIFTVIGVALCVLLLPVLVINVTLLIKGFIHQDTVPTFGGVAPLIVLTDSMYPTIESGDLIIVRQIDAAEVQEGDVISFFDPASSGTAVVTHRVLKQNPTQADGLPATFNPDNEPGVVTEDGKLVFYTQGDANNAPDRIAVPAENLVGVWRGTRFAGLGRVAMFLQSAPGLILCIALPVLLLVGYDVIRRRRYDKSKKQDTDDLLAELERLRGLQQGGESAPSADPAPQDPPAGPTA